MKRHYVSSINIIRIFFAIFIACIAHYMIILSGSFLGGNVSDEVLDIIYVGVEVFFTISGFFAYISYHIRIVDDKMSFISFMWGRIKRLYPTMIISVIVITIAQWISFDLYGNYAILNAPDRRNSLLSVILSLLGVNCGWISNHDSLSINGATWYISILMICYILFYIASTVARRSRVCFFVFVISLMILGILILTFDFDLPLLYLSNGRGYTDFFMGVCLAAIYSAHESQKSRRIMLITGIVLLIVYAILRIVISRVYLCYMCSFLFCPGIMLLFLNSRFLNAISDNATVKYLGRISFDIYLFNMPLFAWIVLIGRLLDIEINYSNIAVWLICAALNIAVAIIIRLILDKIHIILTRESR